MALPVNKYNGIFDKLCDSGHPVIQVTLWHLCKCYYCWRKKIGFLLNDSCELLLSLSYVFPLCAN